MPAATPRVSIAIPAYNNARYLGQTIESALAQTFTDFEVVIADHSSADESAAIIEQYRSHPKVRILEPTPAGGGALRNWNRVSEASAGDYLKLLCGDDLLDEHALEVQVAALDANPSAVLVASKRRLLDAHGKVFLKSRGLGKMNGLTPGHDAIRAAVVAGANLFGEPGCVLMRRATLVEVGLWDSENPYLIDQATYVRLLHHGDLFALKDTLASFRLTATQWSARLVNEQSSQAIAFHEREHRSCPDQISRTDVAIGNFNVRRTALTRRLTYVVLGERRLTPA